MSKKQYRYVIISPVRNEQNNIRRTLEAVILQTIKPIKWIIVDDGSTDDTTAIVEDYCNKYNWLELLKLSDRGYYDLMSGGEIKAFFAGYEKIKNLKYEYLVKVDGDVAFESNYFENLLSKFEDDKKLGIASGSVFYEGAGNFIYEKAYKYHVRGAARVYRKECWDEIGGTYETLGWDAIDVYKARMYGWKTMSFDELKIIHLTKTWTKGGIIHGRMRSGRMEYLIGSHPLFFLVKVVRELINGPLRLSSYAYITGYLKSFISCESRVSEKELIKFIRHEQIMRMKDYFK